jgi:hypothetical protein
MIVMISGRGRGRGSARVSTTPQNMAELIADLHRLIERGDNLRVALAWQLEENALLRR